MEGDFEVVGSEGFRRLADYIAGNSQKKPISMTAPVSQRPVSDEPPVHIIILNKT
ncbi:putative heme-binding protein [Desulfosarcina variabilis str. Montpellier]|uniref:heme-binding protein n=1 Tax=Desulfosarcina variabilis TaxID=2300 RepID=UPI003AFAC6D6